MATMMLIALKLVPALLQAHGVAAGLKELTAALALGTVPGRRERAGRGAWRGGAAGLAQARGTAGSAEP